MVTRSMNLAEISLLNIYSCIFNYRHKAIMSTIQHNSNLKVRMLEVNPKQKAIKQ